MEQMQSRSRSKQQLLAGGKAPLYYRLAETLIRKIEAGEHKKGELFPGDLQLAEEYGVSLITVRAAMRMLIERGLVARYAGKGSFVLSRQQIRAQWGLGSIDDLVTTGLQAKMTLLGQALVTPPEWVRQKYAVPPKTRLYWFRTVRQKQGERFLLNDIYLPVRIGKKIQPLDFKDTQVNQKLMVRLVEEHCGLTLSKMNQTMSAELAATDVAAALGMPAGHPILVIDRDYFSSGGALIQVTRSRYRLDHYRYTINVERLGGQQGD